MIKNKRVPWLIAITLLVIVVIALNFIQPFTSDNEKLSGLGLNELPPILSDWNQSGVQTILPYNEGFCDLNRNDRCDNDDYAIFKNSLGSCSGNSSYYPFADANRDGCITEGDGRVLFQYVENISKFGNV